MKIGNASALGTAAGNTIISSGATLDLNGLSIAEPFGANAGTLTNTSATAASITGTITGGNFSVGGTGNMTFSLATGGTVINKSGTGTLTLGGTGDNVSTSINVTGGTVVLGKTSTTGVHALGAASTAGAGGTIQLGGTGDYQWYGGANLTVSSGGVLDLNGKNQNWNGAGGTLYLNGTGISSGGALINSSAGTNSTLTFGTGTLAMQSATSFGGAGNISISGVVGGAFALTKIGAGTLYLNGTNTYSGGTTVSAGALSYQTTVAKPATGTTTVAALAALGLGVSTSGNYFTSANVDSLFANSLPGVSMNPTSNVGIDTTAGDFTYATSITTRGLVKLGTNTLTLTGTNTYTGGTIIGAGTLLFPKITAMPATGVVAVGTGATLAVNAGGSGEFTSATSGNGSIGGLLAGLGGQSGSTVTYSGAVALGIDTTNAGGSLSYSNAIANVGTSLGLTKLGTGTLTLAGANTYTGATTVTGGKLTVTGSINMTNATNDIVVANTANGNSVLDIQGNVTTHWLYAGTTTGAAGAVYMKSGTYTGGADNEIGFTFGAGPSTGGYGYFGMTGGTVNTNRLQFGGQNVAAQNGVGVGLISGGTVTSSSYVILSRYGTSPGTIGTLTVATGGTLNHNAATNNIGIGWQGVGRAELNLTGGIIDNTGKIVQYGAGTWTGTGIVNLDAGTLTTTTIANTSGTSYLNFAGGTLKAASAQAAFLPALTGVYVNGAFGSFSGGALIDTNGVGVTIAAPLIAPTGNGVATIPVTNGGSGYIGAPAVSITDSGSGFGATAIANMVADATGNGTLKIDSITITNPGNNYTAPAVSLIGGGNGVTAATLGALTSAANTSGGLTKNGAGTLTLSAVNTYSGGTTLAAGTLQLGNAGALGSGTLTFTGGNLDSTVANLVNANNNAQAWNADFTFAGTQNLDLGTGAVTLGANRLVTVAANNLSVSGAIGGAYSLSKAGAGTLTLSGSNTYSGGTAVNAGTLTYLTTAAQPATGNTTVAAGATLAFGVGASGSYFTSTYLNSLFANSVTNVIMNPLANIGIDTTAGNFTYVSNTASTYGLVKLGANTLTLSGTSNYSGSTSVNAGILQLQGAGSLPSGSAVNLGAVTFQYLDDGTGSNGTIAPGNSITLSAAGSPTINVGNNGSANTGNTVAFGALNNGTALNTFNSAISFTAANGYLQSYSSLGLSGLTGNNTTLNPTSTSVVITGAVTNQESGTVTGHYDTLTLDGTSTGNAINGVISDNAGYASVGNGDTRVTKSNTSTWTLRGINTFHGPVAISGGTLQLGGAGQLGAGAYAGTVSIAASSTFEYGSSAAQTLSGIISGAGTLVKDTGSGALTLSGANTYSGGTILNATTLQVTQLASNINGLGTGTVTVNGGSLTVNYGATGNTFINAVTGTGTVNLSAANAAAVTTPVFKPASLNGFTGTVTIDTGFDYIFYQLNPPSGTTFDGSGCNWVINNQNANSFVYTGATGVNLVRMGALSGTGSVSNNTISTTLEVGALGTSTTFSGLMKDNQYGGANKLSVNKVGSGSLELSGVNTYTGTTSVSAGTLVISGNPTGNSAISVNGGTLQLDYTNNNTSKINDLAVLTLAGGTLDLKSGSHTEVVASITVGAGASIDFGASNIATTSNVNNALGFLGSWATVGGTDLAVNASSPATGLIVAYTAYADVQRQTAGTINDAAASNVRIVEGSGTNSILLGSATTTINTLNQSNSGGNSAAMIDPAGQTLRTNGILVGTGAGALTIGTGTNNGTLSTATSGGDLALINYTSNGLTINSVIADNTSVSSLTKLGAGPATLAGANTYSGVTTLGAGTLVLNNGALGTATSSAIGTGALTIAGGSLDCTVAGITLGTNNAQNWNGDFTFIGTQSLNLGTGAITTNANRIVAVNSGTLTTGGSLSLGGTSLTKIGAGNLAINGSVDLSTTKQLIANGGTLTFGGTLTAAQTQGFGILVGNAANASAAMVQTGGSVTFTGVDTSNILNIGNADTTPGGSTGASGGFGAYTMTGGTLTATRINVGGADQPTGVTTGTNSVGLFTVLNGAKATFTNYFIGGRTAASNTGVATIAGGTLDLSSLGNTTGTYAGGRFEMNFGANLGGGNTGGTFNVGAKNFSIVANASTSQGIVNLLGGTLTANLVNTLGGVATGTGIAQFNFNGGTLQYGGAAAQTGFFAAIAAGTAAGSGAFVRSGGATIDSNGQSITIAAALVAPTGGQVTGITATGATGFITAPYVKIVGGNNDATAVAQIDGSGNLTGILVTNPGTGYATAPTVTLVGGTTAGGTNITTGTATATVGASTSGGLTKIGAGTLILSGVNTYTGGTTVSSGALTFSGFTTQPTTGTLAINSGTTVNLSSLAAATATTPTVSLTGAGALNVILSGGFGNQNTCNYNLSGYTGVLDISGAGGRLLVQSPFVSPTSAAKIIVENGTTLYLGWLGSTTLSATVQLNGTTDDGENMGQLRVENNNHQNGPVILSANSTIGNNSGGSLGYIGGVISDGGSGYGFTTQGSATGTLVLQAANTFSGDTNVTAAGTGPKLNLANGLALQNSSVSMNVANGVAFGTGIGTFTLGGLKGAQNLSLQDTGSVAVALRVGNNNSTTTYSGVLSGTGSVTKIGTGTLILSGANTYSGNTTVNTGTLTLSNSAAPTNVNSGNDASTVTIADSGAFLNLTYTGTDIVDKLFIGTTQMAAGVYGAGNIVIPQITGTGTLTVISNPPGFASWINGSFANGTVPLSKQGPNDDPTNDGVSNLLKYAIAGQDPTVRNSMIGTFTANTLSFTKRPGVNGLTYSIVQSSDLGDTVLWTEVPSGPAYTNNSTTISYTFTPGTPVKNFIRLKVTQTP